MILAVLYFAILTVTSYIAISKDRISRVSFSVGAIRLIFLLLIFMHISDTLRGLLSHEPLL